MGRGRDVRTASLLLAATLCVGAAPATASPESPEPSDYIRTEWTRQQNGLPSGTIRAITQDAEGYLWLGMDNGLVRFDGTQFIPSPHSDALREHPPISSLASASDGSIWLGFGDPG